jgi:hypothetical protein
MAIGEALKPKSGAASRSRCFNLVKLLWCLHHRRLNLGSGSAASWSSQGPDCSLKMLGADPLLDTPEERSANAASTFHEQQSCVASPINGFGGGALGFIGTK